jgi:hypothetical protein
VVEGHQGVQVARSCMVAVHLAANGGVRQSSMGLASGSGAGQQRHLEYGFPYRCHNLHWDAVWTDRVWSGPANARERL